MKDYKKLAEDRLEAGGFSKALAKSDYDTIIQAYTDTMQHEKLGMMFRGGVGSGKTMAMRLIAPNAHFIDLADIGSQNVLQSYEEFVDGVSVERWWLIYNDNTVILDDLGNEPIKSNYGVKTESVSNFIMKWYSDVFKREGHFARLHVTTNLTRQQLVERYGIRVVDRLLEMVCTVNFANTSKRTPAKTYGVER
jgi:hypothetical protein